LRTGKLAAEHQARKRSASHGNHLATVGTALGTALKVVDHFFLDDGFHDVSSYRFLLDAAIDAVIVPFIPLG
jgi:hypothetical protein